MTVDRKRLFEQLEPPPGGVERVRARLAEEKTRGRGASRRSLKLPRFFRPHPFLRLAGLGVAAVLILAVVSRLPFDAARQDGPLPDPETRQSSVESGSEQGPGTATRTTEQSPSAASMSPAPRASRTDSLIDAPEFDRLLGRTPEPVPFSVSIDGEEVDVVQVASSDPRVRVYMVARNGND